MSHSGPISGFESPAMQFKGEVTDLEFTLDSDHRKRRRNRTTQSCLNCHTSKRKVRYRLMSLHNHLFTRHSAIESAHASDAFNWVWYSQLSLSLALNIYLLFWPQTGLCVYEIDDPASR